MALEIRFHEWALLGGALALAGMVGCQTNEDLGSESDADVAVDTSAPDAAHGSDAGSTDAPVSKPGSGSGSSDSRAPDAGSGSGSGGAPLVLFGGQNGAGVLGDTWTWDGTAWTQQQVTGPSPREQSSGSALNGTVLLFGGQDETGDLGDTWTWKGSTWTSHSGTGPDARATAAAATLDGKVVLFGGDGDDLDTWTWSGAGWTDLSIDGPDDGLDWSASTLGTSLLLIGNGGMYAWNGSSWNNGMQITGPTATDGASVATLGDQVVYFGGNDPDSFGALNQTWTWDGSSWTVHNVGGPSARAYAGMATYGDKVVLFGGCTYGFAADTDAGPTCMSDTWIWDGTNWTQLDVLGPSARAPAIMVAP